MFSVVLGSFDGMPRPAFIRHACYNDLCLDGDCAVVGDGHDYERASRYQLSDHVHCDLQFRHGGHTYREACHELQFWRLERSLLGNGHLQRDDDRCRDRGGEVRHQFLSADGDRADGGYGDDYQQSGGNHLSRHMRGKL